MKKVMGKLLSAMLILTLVFTSASVAFADSSETGAGEMKAKVSSVQTEDAVQAPQLEMKSEKVEVVEKAATTKASGSFSLVTVKTGNESIPAPTITYGINDTLSGNYKGYSQKVPISAKGTIIMEAQAISNGTYGGVEFGLYRDAALNTRVDSTGYASANGSKDTQIIRVPAGGTYYLGVKSSILQSSSSQAYAVAVACRYFSGTNRTIYNKKQIAVGQRDAQTNYFRFKAVRNGYLKVQSSEGYDKVTLCNSKKKALSNAVSTNYSPTFGVKKGKIYYVKVAAGYNLDGAYALKVTNSTISEKSGKKKSRAVLLKKKRTKKGTIVAGEKRTDWYKIRVPKRKSVRITMKGATNDELKIAIYKGNRRVGRSTLGYYSKSITLRSVGKLSKGTYYIKVYRGTKKSSGWYSLRWK